MCGQLRAGRDNLRHDLSIKHHSRVTSHVSSHSTSSAGNVATCEGIYSHSAINITPRKGRKRIALRSPSPKKKRPSLRPVNDHDEIDNKYNEGGNTSFERSSFVKIYTDVGTQTMQAERKEIIM